MYTDVHVVQFYNSREASTLQESKLRSVLFTSTGGLNILDCRKRDGG